MIIMRVMERIDEQLMTAQYKSNMADGRPSKGQLSFFSEKAARTRMATTANATGKTLFTLKPPIERLYDKDWKSHNCLLFGTICHIINSWSLASSEALVVTPF